MTPGLSIVVPAYNEEKILPETLSYLKEACRVYEEAYRLPAEIIVVDNASTDQTSSVAQRLGARVVHHEIRNIASVRNAGIRASKYNVGVTVDADTYVPPHAFREIWKEMSTGKYVGGGVRIQVRTPKLHFKIFVAFMDLITVYLVGLSAGLFFFNRELALEAGGFPEKLLIAEDLTFAKNLKKLGASRGLKYRNLRSVTIETFDRKDFSFWAILGCIWQGIRAFLGAELKREDLDYWYNPKR